jgi:hypothetical protein
VRLSLSTSEAAPAPMIPRGVLHAGAVVEDSHEADRAAELCLAVHAGATPDAGECATRRAAADRGPVVALCAVDRPDVTSRHRTPPLAAPSAARQFTPPSYSRQARPRLRRALPMFCQAKVVLHLRS